MILSLSLRLHYFRFDVLQLVTSWKVTDGEVTIMSGGLLGKGRQMLRICYFSYCVMLVYCYYIRLYNSLLDFFLLLRDY